MSDRDPIWDVLKEHSKAKFDADRARFAAQADAQDDGGWHKHSPHHWSRMVGTDRLDYWPTRKKYQFRGKVRRGDVYAVIRQAIAEVRAGVEVGG